MTAGMGKLVKLSKVMISALEHIAVGEPLFSLYPATLKRTLAALHSRGLIEVSERHDLRYRALKELSDRPNASVMLGWLHGPTKVWARKLGRGLDEDTSCYRIVELHLTERGRSVMAAVCLGAQ
jgi:hypothetical protein